MWLLVLPWSGRRRRPLLWYGRRRHSDRRDHRDRPGPLCRGGRRLFLYSLGLCCRGNALLLCRPLQQLVGGRHTGLAVKKSQPFLLLGGRRFFPHQRSLIHRDIDFRAARPGLGQRFRRPLSLALLSPAPAWLLRLWLIFIFWPVKDPVRHIHQRTVKGGQSHQNRSHGKDDRGAQAGKQGYTGLGQHTGQHTSGSHRLAAVPQLLDQRTVPRKRI